MILLDTSGLFAALDRSQAAHAAARRALEAADGPLVLSPFVLAELDYLLGKRISTEASLELLRDIEAGAYELAAFSADDVAEARSVIERHRDLKVGLADASIVVLAGQRGIDTVLTLDERHFRVLTTPHRGPFRLLPADAHGQRM